MKVSRECPAGTRRGTDVDATSLRRIDVSMTSLGRHVPTARVRTEETFLF